jgi:hypothetical protein
MARKTKAPRPARADRAAEHADYATWKVEAMADLTNRHDAKASIIPERLWRLLYIQGRSPQQAADRAIIAAHTVRVVADRLKRR